jgi:hypothetical protein
MHFRALSTIAIFVLAVVPLTSHAEFYKCVDAGGAVTFSDRPCSTKDGQKAADLTDNAGFSSILAKDRDKAIGQSCFALLERRMQCNVYIEPAIQTYFHDGCTRPVKRYARERAREEQVEQEQGDWENDYRYGQLLPGKTTAELKCDALLTDTWEFVKGNFAKIISEQDLKEIDYKIQAAASDAPDQALSGRRRRR